MPARITRTSPITGITRTLEFGHYTELEFEKRLVAYLSGKLLLEEAFDAVSSSARYFIKTGITEDEYKELSGLHF